MLRVFCQRGNASTRSLHGFVASAGSEPVKYNVCVNELELSSESIEPAQADWWTCFTEIYKHLMALEKMKN